MKKSAKLKNQKFQKKDELHIRLLNEASQKQEVKNCGFSLHKK